MTIQDVKALAEARTLADQLDAMDRVFPACVDASPSELAALLRRLAALAEAALPEVPLGTTTTNLSSRDDVYWCSAPTCPVHQTGEEQRTEARQPVPAEPIGVVTRDDGDMDALLAWMYAAAPQDVQANAAKQLLCDYSACLTTGCAACAAGFAECYGPCTRRIALDETIDRLVSLAK